MKNLTFITGGARSGKSVLAEKLAASAGLPVYYLATMDSCSNDAEQAERIKRHRRRRPEHWTTIETGAELSAAVDNLPKGQPAICIVDCLSLHVSRLVFSGAPEEKILDSIDALIDTISKLGDLHVLCVSNEVGSSVVPENELGRAFRDVLGFANQCLAQAADNVYLTVSGLPVTLKTEGKLVLAPQAELLLRL